MHQYMIFQILEKSHVIWALAMWNQVKSPLLMLERECSDLGVDTIPADALAPKVGRASEGMVLTV